jgi:hypothetical protein
LLPYSGMSTRPSDGWRPVQGPSHTH